MRDHNKALVCRFIDEMLKERNLSVIDELAAPDFRGSPCASGAAPGLEGVRQTLPAVLAALADIGVVTDDVIAEGRHQADRGGDSRWTVSRVPGTGKRLKWTAISICRISGGRIAERWGLIDYRGLQSQLAA